MGKGGGGGHKHTHTHLGPKGGWHVEARRGRTLLARVLEGTAQRRVDDGGHVGRSVHQVEVLAAALAHQARQVAVVRHVGAHLKTVIGKTHFHSMYK